MPAVNPSTDRPTSWLADDETPGDLEHLAQPDAGPLRVPDEPATDLVADAGDGHVLLEHRQGQQLVPGQRGLTLHETVDPQGPGGDVHARDQQRGVDPVEIARSGRRSGSGRASSARGRPRRRGVARSPTATGSSAAVIGAVRDRSSRLRPPRPATSADRPTAPVRSRNERRAGSEAATTVRVRSDAHGARARSHDRVCTPSPTATAAWAATKAGLASGSPRAAAKPSTPNAANPAAASGEATDREDAEDRHRTPATRGRRRPRAPPCRSSRRARRRSPWRPAGCRSMTTWPTAATSEVAPGSSAAINSDTPRATAAAATPAAAASTARRRRTCRKRPGRASMRRCSRRHGAPDS